MRNHQNVWNMKEWYIGLFFLVISSDISAQCNRTYDDLIKSLQVEVNGDWSLPPVMVLGGGDYIEISFDRLTHEYRDLRYFIKHCNADWSVSDMYEIDYLDGFNNNCIDDNAPSLNTTVDYTHYSLRIPNENVSLKLSGNYILEIADYDDDRLLAEVCFSVLEPQISVGAKVSSNTTIDTNKNHQQVSIYINSMDYEIRFPQTELKVYVRQNCRVDNWVTGIKPSFIGNGRIEYVNDKNLIFNAGNEFRRFEMLNESDVMMGVSKIGYYAPYYHATLYTDQPRKNYYYDEDQDGRFIIRNNNSYDSATEADYAFVHFTLHSPYLHDSDVYITGELSNNLFDDYNRMIYNDELQQYEKTLLLKQGIYNYQYLSKAAGAKEGNTADIEGDYYETENQYTIYVYHRAFGERYDRFIGFSTVYSE